MTISASTPLLVIALALLLSACGGEPAAPAESAAAAAPGAPAAPAEPTAPAVPVEAAPPPAPPAAEPPAEPAVPAAFDPASVPESSATLPPLPFFTAPEGLTSTFDDGDKRMGFVRQYFMAGATPTPVEGEGWRERFNLENDTRRYSALEFHRNYEQAIAALGGQKISTAQYTREVVKAAGGPEFLALINKDSASAAAIPDYEHHSYLIRQGGREFWINVSTGSFPLHGYVVIVERVAFKPSVFFLDAAAMKQALDTDGRVALYVNFDVDKATLRPDAQPVIAEVVSLLASDPALKLAIEGHTDSSGSAERNRELSAQRARSVLGALVGGGIDPARLSSAGFGPDRPLADNGSDEGRAKNRRVELVRQP